MQVKLWTPSNGFCFVTFAEHTAPITGLAFLPNSAAVVSSSLDGTVRAFDLIRYRNFRTMISPTPQQFGSLAVDPSGEVSGQQSSTCHFSNAINACMSTSSVILPRGWLHT